MLPAFNRSQLCQFLDSADLICAAAKHVSQCCQEAIAHHGVFNIGLSGGRTPVALFRLLRQPSWQTRLDWQHTRVFWVDERCVPQEHPASNSGVARRECLDHVPVRESFPLWTGHGSPEEHASAYETLLRRELPIDEGRGLDVVLLGMGADGHTASLFPGTPQLHEQSRLVVPAEAPLALAGEGPQRQRLTLTFPMLALCDTGLVLVAGRDKAHAMRHLFAGSDESSLFPARYVKTARTLAWLADAEACSGLPKKILAHTAKIQ